MIVSATILLAKRAAVIEQFDDIDRRLIRSGEGEKNR